jgi:hypothetical protein
MNRRGIVMGSARSVIVSCVVVIGVVAGANDARAAPAKVTLAGLDPAAYLQRRNRTPELSRELSRLPHETLLAIARGDDVVVWPRDDAYGDMQASARAAARATERRALLQGVLAVMARQDDERFATAMIALLDDADPAVAGSAAERLGALPHQEPLLTAIALDDERRLQVRTGACAGLGAQRSDAAVSALIAVVGGKGDDALKISALTAIEFATSRWAFEARGDQATGERLRGRAATALSQLVLSEQVGRRRDAVLKRLR